jgi:sortase A
MRRVLRGAGWCMISMGAFALYFLVYQLVGTGATSAKAQADLTRDLAQQWAEPAGTASPPRTGHRPAPEPVQPGRAFAIIEMPKIDLEKAVVEGADRDDLRKGPGHIPTTALPWEPGTFAVSGHRTTYGAPFFDLDKLAKGDAIVIRTRSWVYRYAVTRSLIVRPQDVWVLDDVRGPGGKAKQTIVLTTCNPKYSARQRLIVFGDLVRTQPRQPGTAR